MAGHHTSWVRCCADEAHFAQMFLGDGWGKDFDATIHNFDATRAGRALRTPSQRPNVLNAAELIRLRNPAAQHSGPFRKLGHHTS